jgi:MFS family permease
MTKIILLLGANLTLIGGATLIPVIPAIEAEFSAIPNTTFWVSLIITLPALFVVIGGPISGLLTDKIGRKWVLQGSILLAAISGSAGLILDTLPGILAMRAIMGLCISGATTATNALISDMFDGHERARFLGLQAAICGLGGIVFMPLGGFLANFNWHLSFVTYLPLFLIFPLAIFFIHEPGIAQGSEKQHPTQKFQINPTLSFILIVNFVTQFGFLSVSISIGNYIQEMFAAENMIIGLICALSSCFYFIGGLLFGRVIKRWNFRKVTVISLIGAVISFAMLAFTKSWPFVILSQMLSGLTFGLLTSNLTTWVADLVHISVRGRANGLLTTTGFLGQFLTSVIITPLIAATSHQFSYLTLAIFVGITTVIGALFLRRTTIHDFS